MTFGLGDQSSYPRFYTAIYFSLVVVFFFSFLSKAGMNIFTGIAYMAAFLLLWREGLRSLRMYSWWIFFVIPLVIGSFLSLFTVAGGVEEAGHFLARFKFFLLPVVIAIVAKNRKSFLSLFVVAWFSALIATLYGFSQPEQRELGGFNGVHFILRNADMLVVVILAMLVFLLDKAFCIKYQKWLWVMWPTLALFIYGLVMSTSRGSWLGFVIGVLVLGVLFHRRILAVVFVVAILVMVFASGTRFMAEAESISNLQTNHSNSARLQLWSSGWGFSLNQFWQGVGHSKIEPLFLDYYYDQPDFYQEKYRLATQYPWDFHNSYLQILIEWGALYFLVFTACGVILLRKLYESLSQAEPENKSFVRAAIVVSAGYLPIQFFHNELYGYGTVIYLLVLTSGLLAQNWGADVQEVSR